MDKDFSRKRYQFTGYNYSNGRLPWPEDIDLDLSAELMNSNQYSNDSLLNFPNLTVFKQEIPSPPNQSANHNGSNEMLKTPRSPPPCVRITSQLNPTAMMNGSPAEHHQQQHIGEQQTSGSTSSSNGLANFLEQLEGNNQGSGNNQSNNEDVNRRGNNHNDDRFQYVLAAATSIATKSNEETLTYLNQGQSYEIKLKKLGDLSTCRGKVMKSVVKICFHERRLQYMEREQMHIWQSSRPGERILDIDIPLSYGLLHVNHSPLLNTAEILWDPMKEVGVYIKVNCISTEFTPKKHGGEKGVPFRIQIETYVDGPSETKPLHAAACQIKVFKLKGADRKHKQDRERIQKRPPSEQDKYQRSYECTILNDISSESLVTSTIGYNSPEHIKRNHSPVMPTSPIHVPSSLNPLMPFVTSIGNVSSTNGLCKLDQNVVSTQNYDSDDLNPITITKESTPSQLTQWLTFHRLTSYANIFGSFSGCDLLRLAKEDLIQICGLADGIRMYNILHAKAIKPRLTIFVSTEGSNTYNAVYMHSATTKELVQKLYKIPGLVNNSNWKFSSSPNHNGSNSNLNDDSNFKIYINGPNNVLVLVNDEVLANIKDESLFALEVNNGSILMKSVKKSD
ncbi:transcription factor CP2-like protein 1 isoform X2 [Chironomus tepperi]|uniref:transcription factor CP2-like protein 1 isoform X2 n=1 Tax=Chironomus tepperi TaxID=113505 RepID=UPI00391F8A99